MDLLALFGSSVLLVVRLAAMGLALLFSLGVYLLQSFAVMQMAKKRSIENPWLAFVPFANSWMIGRVAERPGKRSHATLLVTLQIAAAVLAIPYLVFAFLLGFSVAEGSSFVLWLVLLIVTFLLFFAACIAFSVFLFISYHRICTLFDPKNASAWFLGGLIPTLLGVGFVLPILLLILSRKEIK